MELQEVLNRKFGEVCYGQFPPRHLILPTLWPALARGKRREGQTYDSSEKRSWLKSRSAMTLLCLLRRHWPCPLPGAGAPCWPLWGSQFSEGRGRVWSPPSQSALDTLSPGVRSASLNTP